MKIIPSQSVPDGWAARLTKPAPLIVFVTPHGRFQLQMGGQFRDQEDKEPNADFLKDAPEGFARLLRSLQ